MKTLFYLDSEPCVIFHMLVQAREEGGRSILMEFTLRSEVEQAGDVSGKYWFVKVFCTILQKNSNELFSQPNNRAVEELKT